MDYIYDLSGHWIMEVNNNGTPCADEFYAGGRHIVSVRGSTTFSHTDWLGTERVRIEYPEIANRAYDEHCSSLPFGDGLTCTPSSEPDPGPYTSPLHFTGKERDSESGLDHFDFRKYSSSLGRFMTPDPAGIFVADKSFPQSWNLYSYVRTNPLNFIDPNGLDCAYLNDSGTGAESIDHNSNIGECQQNGGYWANGTINQLSWVQPNVNNDTAVIYSQFSNGGVGVSLASQTWTQGAFGLSDEASSSLYSFQQWTPLTWNERAVREIAKALPTVCSAGVYYYAGRELEAGPVNGFAGAIHEYDTKAGSPAVPCLRLEVEKVSWAVAASSSQAIANKGWEARAWFTAVLERTHRSHRPPSVRSGLSPVSVCTAKDSSLVGAAESGPT